MSNEGSKAIEVEVKVSGDQKNQESKQAAAHTQVEADDVDKSKITLKSVIPPSG